MKLIVLGATGGTGLQIIERALQRGHSVTAFVRSTERLNPFRDRITIRQGNLLNSAELVEVVSGQEAIVSGFGPRLPIAKSDRDLLHRFSISVTQAMLEAGIRRVVVESTAFLFKDSIFPPAYLFGRLFFPTVVVDAAAMERVFRESGLDWTIVRPPELTNKAYTGKYRVREGHLPRFGLSISRADVADCLVRAAEDPATIQKILGTSR